MNIIRVDSQKEKMLTEKFKEDTLSLTSIAPGDYKSIEDLLTHNEYDFMSHQDVKKNIEENFGKSKNSVLGKSRPAKLYAFEFKNEIIICTIESGGVGTKWYWVDSCEDGSRYNKPYLLPSDKKAVSFWPDFCKALKNTLQ